MVLSSSRSRFNSSPGQMMNVVHSYVRPATSRPRQSTWNTNPPLDCSLLLSTPTVTIFYYAQPES